MKANISLNQLYFNASLMDFFFRGQSQKTFMALLDGIYEGKMTALTVIEERAEELYDNDVDLLKQMFHESSISELCEIFGLTLKESDERPGE